MSLDLVVQASRLAPSAVAAFSQAVAHRRLLAGAQAARLEGVAGDAATGATATALAAQWHCDAAFVAAGLRLADFRVIAFDMDSTLITIECIDEVARGAGRGEEVARITEASMRGEITDYRESLRRRVQMLAGVDAGVLARVAAERLQLSPGAGRLVAAARAAGLATLLVSGGFRYFTSLLQRQLGFDTALANEIEIVDGRLTGRVAGPAEAGGEIIDAAGKARALAGFCTAHGCTPGTAIAVGDGANDLAMLAAAGLSVAYRAKPVVQQQAAFALNHSGLDGLLNLFVDGGGYEDR